MIKTTKTLKLLLRKENIRLLAPTKLVIVAGGDLTTVTRETNMAADGSANVDLNNNPGTGCD